MENETTEPLYFIFQGQVVEFFLHYNVAIIGACVFAFFLLQFKDEYFPSKARVYDLSSALIRRATLCRIYKSSKK